MQNPIALGQFVITLIAFAYHFFKSHLRESVELKNFPFEDDRMLVILACSLYFPG